MFWGGVEGELILLAERWVNGFLIVSSVGVYNTLSHTHTNITGGEKKKKKKKTFLAHPLRVIKLQARALGLPHVVCPIEGPDYLGSYQVYVYLCMCVCLCIGY